MDEHQIQLLIHQFQKSINMILSYTQHQTTKVSKNKEF